MSLRRGDSNSERSEDSGDMPGLGQRVPGSRAIKQRLIDAHGRETETGARCTSPTLRRHVVHQLFRRRTVSARAVFSRGSSCSAQDLPTVADGIQYPSHNRPAVAVPPLREVDPILWDPNTTTSRAGDASVASPKSGVSRPSNDARPQPPEPRRQPGRNEPGLPNYGFGWSESS